MATVSSRTSSSSPRIRAPATIALRISDWRSSWLRRFTLSAICFSMPCSTSMALVFCLNHWSRSALAEIRLSVIVAPGCRPLTSVTARDLVSWTLT